MAPDSDGPIPLLPDHHLEIEKACSALLACAYADDSRDLIGRYRAFEHALLEHLDAEEDTMLSAYCEAHPADGACLRSQHTELRKQLFAVGVEVELHTVRVETLQRLLAALRRHAELEDETLYRWADRHLAPTNQREVTERITASLGALRRVAPRPLEADGAAHQA